MGRSKKETTTTESAGGRLDRRLPAESRDRDAIGDINKPTDMVVICMGQFGMTLEEALRNTPRAFFYYQQAYKLKLQEQMFLASYSSWQDLVVKSETGSGKSRKPRYQKFSDFYDYTGELHKALKGEARDESREKDVHGLTLADRNLLISKALRSGKAHQMMKEELEEEEDRERKE